MTVRDQPGRMQSELVKLDAAIEGEVIFPGSPEYEAVRKPAWAQYANLRPAAVVRCSTPEDVVEAIRFARRLGVVIAVRSGGHCFAGHSSTAGLLIDLSPMSAIEVSNGTAALGGGARLGEIDERLERHGLAIAAGSCPSVGIAGLTLGGGLGVLGRKYGLTSDQLRGAQVVLGDGRVLDCDEQREGGLFWALRGAGAGQFGVVTRFVFETVPAPELTCFRLVWTLADAIRLLEAWQSWAPDAPDELAASLLVNAAANPELPARVTLFGTMVGTKSETARVLDGLVARAGADPGSMAIEHLGYAAAKRYLVENAPGGEPALDALPAEQPRPILMFAKSEFFHRLLPRRALSRLVDNFMSGRHSGEARELDFSPWGGAYNRVHPQATAFVHRQERFLLKHAVVLTAQTSDSKRGAANDWLARSWAIAHDWGSGGVFSNFADPGLTDWAHAYYGVNLDRLVRLKGKYDGANVFDFDQSLLRTSDPSR